jgi:uncharacterized protein (TIGR02391 family)
MSEELEMTFDPNTIEHLGVRMYSTLPPVLAELIGNAYDADADLVEIVLKDADGDKEIVIRDTGVGMTFDEINDKFLRIGRARREEDGDLVSPKGRKAIGKKGLGKLAFFGIAHEIIISTRKGGKRNIFLMDWDSIKHSPDRNYKPTILEKDQPCPPSDHGTELTLRRIQRESNFLPEDLANGLSRMFIIDPDFKITIQHNSEGLIEVTNERKYADLDKEVEWEVPLGAEFESDYPDRAQVAGTLFTTSRPIPPNTNMRGITLFSRKKLVNLPEYFSDSQSSHFFSYLTGWLRVDFIDELGEDVIGTNRQSLNWDHPEMAKLRLFLRTLLNWLEHDWRAKRATARGKKLSQSSGINVPEWTSKLPPEVRDMVQPILDTLVKDSEMSTEETSATVKYVHNIAPEYPYFHWRHLHPEIQAIAKDDYEHARYFDAAEKSCRLYLQRVKDLSGVDSGSDDRNVDVAFNVGNGVLMVTPCDDTTTRNIQNGQHHLSKGVVLGFRNPLTHNPEYQKKLVDTGLFTEKDCLDVLSLLSHLFGRLGHATVRRSSGQPTTPTQ